MARSAFIIGLILLFTGSLAGLDGWETDFEKARKIAAEEDKAILVNFSGSDWCGWCIRLDEEVFSKDAFKTWAAERVVLLHLDFPKNIKQSDELKAQNRSLQQKYGVRGFPTILFLDPQGNVIGRSGYLEGGPAAWTANAQEQLDNRPPPPAITYAESAAAAQKEAETRKLPLLLVVGPEGDADLDAVTYDPLLILASGQGFVAARITDEKESGYTALLNELDGLVSGKRVLLINTDGSVAVNLVPAGERPGKKILAALPAPVYTGDWIEDFPKAKYLAAALDRPMLLDFTGSDWCGWCIKLDNEIFSTDAFKTFAGKNLILVKLDFPRTKPISEALKKQNNDLAGMYAIRGFPTLIITDPAGNQKGQMGYMEGGPGPFIKKLKGLLPE